MISFLAKANSKQTYMPEFISAMQNPGFEKQLHSEIVKPKTNDKQDFGK